MAPDGTRIPALAPTAGARMPPGDPFMGAGIGSLDEQDDARSQHGAASADDLPGTAKSLRKGTEKFSSCDLAGRKDVDGPGELPGLPGVAVELVRDVPGLELGTGPFARAA